MDRNLTGQVDDRVLAQLGNVALRSDAGYIGMIGSRRKRDALYEAPPPYQDRFGVEPLRASLDGEPVWGELAGGSIAAWRAVVSGEAEYIWKAFCRDFTAGRPRPLYRETGTVALADSPVPRFDLLSFAGTPRRRCSSRAAARSAASFATSS